MVAAGTASRGLSTQDLQSIRDNLSAGRRPKVVFTEAAGQIAGQIGQVVQLTDPAGSDEFVVVRFGRDELPFSPADLAVPAKTAPVRRAAPKPTPEPVTTRPPAPAAREEQTMPASNVDKSVEAAGRTGRSTESRPTESRPTEPRSAESRVGEARVAAGGSAEATAPAAGNGHRAGTGRDPGPATPAEPERPPARKAAKQAKPKVAAGLTITLGHADGEWTLTANAGAKVLAKPSTVRAAEALKMVAMLEVPAVTEAVEQILAAERAVAEQQAQRLRAELAEIEARLSELGALPGS